MPTDPATVPKLTPNDIAAEWDATNEREKWNQLNDWWAGEIARFAHRIAALAAARVDTAEVERRAVSKALTDFALVGPISGISGTVIRFRDRYLARVHPAPAPRECVLSDKSVVRCDDDRVEFTRYRPGHLPRVSKPEHWPLLVTDLNGADFDALKRFAAEVGQ